MVQKGGRHLRRRGHTLLLGFIASAEAHLRSHGGASLASNRLARVSPPRLVEVSQVLHVLSANDTDSTPEPPRARPRTLEDGPVDHMVTGRLHRVLDIGASVEDLELRLKPPFVSIPGQEVQDRLTPQQQKGLEGMFQQPPDDMRDCLLIHQYAEPLTVIDSFEFGEEWAFVSMEHSPKAAGRNATVAPDAHDGKGREDAPDGPPKNLSVLVRPGAIYDSATAGGNNLHIGLTMFANLEGITNPVQVFPHGPVAHWASKKRVPIAGYLCMHSNASDSAPVLHSSPTPCVPTTVDAEGTELDPFLDPYEVFIGTTRVAFNNRAQAEHFCLGYAEEIARDLATQVWDAESLKVALPEPGALRRDEDRLLLALGDVCYRFCEDGSEEPVSRRELCPAEHPCASPLPPGATSFDSCGSHAHTCGGVQPGGAMTTGLHVLEHEPETTTAAPADPTSSSALESAGPSPAPAGLEGGDAGADVGGSPSPAGDGAAPVAFHAEADGDDEAEALAEAAQAMADSSAVGSGLGNASLRLSLAQLVKRGLPSSKRHPHKRWRTLAEARLRMESHERVKARVADVFERGQPSLGLVRNPNLMSFIGMTRHRATPEGWTTGMKKLLVLIMDWKEGDDSMAPYSHQAPNPIPHYKDNIFPQVQSRFSEMSYGKFGVDVTFVPEVVRYTRNRNQFAGKLPFPVLYNEAMEALQGHRTLGSQFAFRNFDLVFVIHPQVNPVGTKGVAWVGARGAVCNGCETISDKFKIMVAVHELGHNLGLAHASSQALEYGNPFDWMGNYPEVQGLSYGVGYKAELQWINTQNIMEITDANVDSANFMVTFTPFDITAQPKPGQVAGVRISLSENPQNVYLSFRATPGSTERGLFVTLQSKDTVDSMLVDAGCHSITQQDAHVQKGWTYMDNSQKVTVSVLEETPEYVKAQIYRTPTAKGAVAAIRGRPGFTDGRTKCPVTCQDSDLLLSQSCASLRDEGYCGGTMTLHGDKMSIGYVVCPRTCGKCEEVMSKTSPEMGGPPCQDKNVQISGMNCADIAHKDMCGSKTTSGKKLGEDLCPFSCGVCPRTPPSSNPDAAKDFPDPQPTKFIGGAGEQGLESVCPGGCQAPTCQGGSGDNGGLPLSGNACTARCSQPYGDTRYCGAGGTYEDAESLDCSACAAPRPQPVCPESCMAPTCMDGDPSNGGTEMNGQVCYARCSQSYGGVRYCGTGGLYSGGGSVDCSRCTPAGLSVEAATAPLVDTSGHPECEDDEFWIDPNGHDCQSYRNTIEKWGQERVCKEHNGGLGGLYCRQTCGTCKAVQGASAEKGAIETTSAGCADNACIGPWMQAFGRCYQCSDFPKGCEAEGYREVFRAECPLTCGVCKAPPTEQPAARTVSDSSEAACKDEEPGFCGTLGMRFCSEGVYARKCRMTCGLCPPGGREQETCVDRFSFFTCHRHKSYGWCTREDTRDAVQLQCPKTCGVCKPGEKKLRKEVKHSGAWSLPVSRSLLAVLALPVLRALAISAA